MQNALDILAERPLLLVVAGGLGSSICGAGLRQTWGSWTMVWWAIGIAIAVALPALGTSRNRLQQGRRAARVAIRKVLMACAATYSKPGGNIRANIMLVKEGHRRVVDKGTAFNMDGDPDCDLDIAATAGVSGEAFVHQRPTYDDLTIGLNPGAPSWGLLDSERAKVRKDLKSILSVPVFDPDETDKLLGTLQVDSTLTVTEMQFDQAERWPAAERFADVIALLLKTGR